MSDAWAGSQGGDQAQSKVLLRRKRSYPAGFQVAAVRTPASWDGGLWEFRPAL